MKRLAHHADVEDARRYRRNPLTAGRVIDGLAFVVTPDDNRLHTLNAAASQLWTLATAPITLANAVDALVASYEIDRETAERDASACLDDMVARHILVAVDAP